VEDAEHGLQLGEVGSSCRDDQARVEELTVELLDFSRVCVARSSQLSVARRYFSFFLDKPKDTWYFSMSQSKPMYVVMEANGLSFDSSQGIPSCSE
jgi:hypothetical protein